MTFSTNVFGSSSKTALPLPRCAIFKNMLELVARATGAGKHALRLLILERDRKFVQRSDATVDRDDRICGAGKQKIAARIAKAGIDNKVVIIERQVIRPTWAAFDSAGERPITMPPAYFAPFAA